MHPDMLEEMDYAANAHFDYIREAYGPTADSMSDDEYFWDSELQCDVRDIPTVKEARHDSHAEACILALCVFFSWADGIPF